MVYIYFAVTSVFYILYFAWQHNKTEDKTEQWTFQASDGEANIGSAGKLNWSHLKVLAEGNERGNHQHYKCK